MAKVIPVASQKEAKRNILATGFAVAVAEWPHFGEEMVVANEIVYRVIIAGALPQHCNMYSATLFSLKV